MAMFKHATLNRAYRLVWSELHATWVAVAEFARTRGKRTTCAVVAGTLLALGAGGVTAADAPAPTALPTGGQVAAGQVGISSSGARMDVTQSSGSAIVNWDSFNIGSQAHVNFAQPAASSVILNRVLGGDGSAIFGRMTANGNVFISNPGGILFAPGAQVDVGGLVASSLGISDANFLAGRYNFAKVGAGGTVTNQGNINVADGGFVALIAPQVANSGTIHAPGGSIGLAAGDSVNLDFDHDGLLSFQVNLAAAGARADNSGVLIADGGRVVMNAQAKDALLSTVLNNDGVIRARSLETRNGEIWLGGGNSGVVSVTGTLDASGTANGQSGGAVKVLGDKVGLFGQASIDVSGVGAGGTALVGGNWQGKGPEQNASATYVGKGVTINADAVGTGNGGKVVVWADDSTRFYGDIGARGGAQSGDGGSVEVSGKKYLTFKGTVNTLASNGKTGILLLDPADITILNGSGNGTGDGDTSTTTFTGTAGGLGTVLSTDAGPTTIYESELEGIAATTNIALTASNSITVDDLTDNNLNLAQTAGNSVSFNAGSGGFVMNGAATDTITTAGGALNITTTGVATIGGLATGGGNVGISASSIAASGAIATNTASATAGGAVTLTASSGGISVAAISTDGTTSGGAVSVQAQNAITLNGAVNSGDATQLYWANKDNAGTDAFTMAAGSSIVTTNAGVSAVEVDLNNGGGTGTGGAVLRDITVGNGGTITLNMRRSAATDFVAAGSVAAAGLGLATLTAGATGKVDFIITQGSQAGDPAGNAIIVDAGRLSVSGSKYNIQVKPGTDLTELGFQTYSGGGATDQRLLTADGLTHSVADAGGTVTITSLVKTSGLTSLSFGVAGAHLALADNAIQVGSGNVFLGANGTITDASGAVSITTTGSVALHSATSAGSAPYGIGGSGSPINVSAGGLAASVTGAYGIYVENAATNLAVGTHSGITGLSNTGAAINVLTPGVLSINQAISGAGVTLAATGTGGNITSAAAGTVNAGAGAVQMTAGKDLTLNASVTAGGTTTLDFGQEAAGTFSTSAGITGTSVAINGGIGDDIVDLSGATAFAATIAGGGGTDTLIGRNVNNAWVVTGPNAGTLNTIISFSAITNLTGGSGTDTLTGLATANTMSIGGTNTVTTSGMTMSSVEALVGGAAADTFTLASGITFSGTIDGAGNTDELKATDGTNAWQVTGANAGTFNTNTVFSNMETLTGGSGTDTLTGLATANTMSIGGTNTVTTSGMTMSSVEALVG
ncbi:MAG: filamentous hemagglutinin N-terminal domain-containing protein, partial [Betaproteobacteria bacterium]|nr:filamentous hemagglutinin N-terminal domain-containing protein [Betaproteobacteria bacterium]